MKRKMNEVQVILTEVITGLVVMIGLLLIVIWTIEIFKK